jgi:hypothetical protein
MLGDKTIEQEDKNLRTDNGWVDEIASLRSEDRKTVTSLMPFLQRSEIRLLCFSAEVEAKE